VADALDSYYQPRFGGDAIAGDVIGQVLAVAERLDTLAGIFAIGMKPGGNKDPFALRRAALGLARTLIEADMDLDLHGSFLEALELIPDSALSAALKPGKDGVVPALKPGRRADLAAELCDFVFDRLRGYYAEQGFDSNQFEAVLAVQPRSLVDFDRRLRAVAEFGRRPEATSLAAANKRVANILRKSEAEGAGKPSALDAGLFETDAERQLAAELDAARRDTADALARGDYTVVLSRLAELQGPLDSFFDSVLVNAEDPAIRANRTALLRQLQDQFTAVADIARL
jgi:glycyl-tRNA synthetase beta chain